jgi:hypothetical protein
MPNFAGDPKDLSQKFGSAIKMVAGSVVPNPPKDFDQYLRDAFSNAKTSCSTTPEVSGNMDVEDIREWSNAKSDRCDGCSLSLSVAEARLCLTIGRRTSAQPRGGRRGKTICSSGLVS